MAKRSVGDSEILAQIPAARGRARRAELAEPHTVGVQYQRAGRRLHIQLTNGAALMIPVQLIPSLRHASDDDLATVTAGPAGIGLHWERVDQDLSIAGLARVAFGSRTLLRASGALGGAARTAAKALAARQNGRKGGRPRKATPRQPTGR